VGRRPFQEKPSTLRRFWIKKFSAGLPTKVTLRRNVGACQQQHPADANLEENFKHPIVGVAEAPSKGSGNHARLAV